MKKQQSSQEDVNILPKLVSQETTENSDRREAGRSATVVKQTGGTKAFKFDMPLSKNDSKENK